MKVCPRCGAIAFDDASLCFGCLYCYDQDNQGAETFGENASSQKVGLLESASRTMPETKNIEKRVPLHSGCALESQEPPEFCIHLIPRHNSWGGWKWDCSVEIAEKVQHEVIGRHAVQVH